MAITHEHCFSHVRFRYNPWGVFPPLALPTLLATALCAANVPTFTYSPAISPTGSANYGQASIHAVTIDSSANTYIAGTILQGTISTTPGAFQSSPGAFLCSSIFGGLTPCPNSFVLKLDPTGAVVFATFFGGTGGASIAGIAVDPQGNVYIAGSCGCDNTYYTPLGTGGAGFVAKLDPRGSRLLYSVSLSANVTAIAVDSVGDAYITGSTPESANPTFPTTPGAFQTKPGNMQSAGIAAKLNAAGSALIYGTFLSGTSVNGDYPQSVAIDAAGNAYISGYTFSTDFPVTPGAFQTSVPSPGSYAFLTKLNPQGGGLVYSTFFAATTSTAVKVDGQGSAFLAGYTNASVPTTISPPPGSISTIGNNGFLARFSADGSSLIYSEYLPAPLYVQPPLDVDSAGNAIVAVAATAPSVAAGNPDYTKLATGVGAFQPEYAGGTSDVYVARYTPEGQISGSTYLGGSLADTATAIALAPNGSIVVAGSTTSSDFPLLSQPILPGNGSGPVPVPFATSIFPSLTAQNAASFAATGIAPGEIVALRGYGIGPTTGVSAPGPNYPTQLTGVQVSFGGFQAPLFYVQSGQLNAQVPWELADQASTMVQISFPGVSSAGTSVAVTSSLPGVFYLNNSDGTRNSPSNPAKPGDFISIYGTGGGVMSAPGVTGSAWPLSPLSLLTLPVSVTVGGEAAPILYAGSAPTLNSGFFQINVRLPADLTTATQFLSVKIGGMTSVPAAISIK